jgi:hypothetical protein
VSTIRAVSTASSALAKLVARALAASGVAMLAKGVRELAFRPLAKAVDLGSLERAVGLSLREKRLKVLRETFDGLTGELFSALDVLGSIEPVVRHVVPLQRELFARRLLLAGGELLRDAEHLFVAPRVLARRRQEILDDAMVAPGCEVDVLFVSGRVAVEDRADEVRNGFEKGFFELLLARSLRERGEVVSDHLSPGSFVTACENHLKFREGLEPVPLELVSSLNEIW